MLCSITQASKQGRQPQKKVRRSAWLYKHSGGNYAQKVNSTVRKTSVGNTKLSCNRPVTRSQHWKMKLREDFGIHQDVVDKIMNPQAVYERIDTIWKQPSTSALRGNLLITIKN